ncbi:MAG: hypothetical protein M3Q15_00145 [Pseudomonadota bacterium]|nr:hypothetical protein [Pseudomonadota bacterium]
MADTVISRVPTWFWVVAIAALLWNLLGVTAYLMQVYDHPAASEGMTEAQRQLKADMPAWVMGAYAIAVFGGAIGALGLLLRKSWAKIAFGISLLAVLAQQAWVFLLSDAMAVMDSNGPVLSLAVIVVALSLLWFARHAERKAWTA